MDEIKFENGFPKFARCAVVGASATGKSEALRKILLSPLFEGTRLDHVVFFYLKKDESFHRQLVENMSVEFHQGVDSLDEILQRPTEQYLDKKVGFVFEDLQNEILNSKTFLSLMTCYTHHLPLSACIFTLQSLYMKTRLFSAINRNITHYIFTASPRNKSTLQYLSCEVFPTENPTHLVKIFDVATKKSEQVPYPLLWLHPDAADERLRCISGVLQDGPLRCFRWKHL